MSEPHYTFVFEGILDQLKRSRVHVTEHSTGLQAILHVSMNDKDFLNLRGLRADEPVADVIDLSTAISIADRWSKRHEEYPCVIHVKLPVRQLALFQRKEIKNYLAMMLYWFTGDIWIFEFVAINDQRRRSELQRHFWESSNQGVQVEVALWSGGLDALAGLCNRIAQRAAERFLLLGEGSNSRMKGVQEQVFEMLRERSSADLHLVGIATAKSGTRESELHKDSKMRARGLVFMLLGSAYAYLEGQRTLAIYENGVGAINLPFRASEVGLDHARSVHPLSLHYVSQFLSLIIEDQFNLHNPFLHWTKAEMCHVLREMGVVDIAWQTVSCDRPHRKDVHQCGRCSSCLLRRESFLAAGIPDQTRYLIQIETGESLNALLRKSQLPHMMYQGNVIRAATAGGNAWGVLATQHPSRLTDMVDRLSLETGENRDNFIEEVVALYQRYADEWLQEDVRSVFEQEIENIKRVPKRMKQSNTVSHEGMPR